jgi:hypothetical protein
LEHPAKVMPSGNIMRNSRRIYETVVETNGINMRAFLEGRMDRLRLSVMMLALISTAACHRKDAAKDDLSDDLMRASSSDALALAPNSAGTTSVVSPQEQVAPRFAIASSRKSSPHRTPHVARETQMAAPASAPAVAAPEPAAPEPVAQAPVAMAPRPQPVAVSYPDPASAGHGNDGGGIGSGRGGMGGVIIRGGTVDGDHCDPRGGRGGTQISIGRTIPVIRY